MWFWQRPRSFKKWTFWEPNVYAKWKLGNCFKGWFRITESWENSSESCILPCVKQMTSANSMHEAGHPKLVLGDNIWVAWRGRWDTCTPWLIHVNVWQKLPQYCNVLSLQLKKKKKNHRVTYLRGEFLKSNCHSHEETEARKDEVLG